VLLQKVKTITNKNMKHLKVFPQHHFAQQRHEGEGRCPARRLPVLDVTAMGFPRGWESEPLWQ